MIFYGYELLPAIISPWSSAQINTQKQKKGIFLVGMGRIRKMCNQILPIFCVLSIRIKRCVNFIEFIFSNKSAQHLKCLVFHFLNILNSMMLRKPCLLHCAMVSPLLRLLLRPFIVYLWAYVVIVIGKLVVRVPFYVIFFFFLDSIISITK